MRAWMLPAGSDGFDKLYLEDLPDPEPGPGEVLIAPKAWSINYRDFAVASGHYFGGALQQPAIPLSDGAGEVIAVGEGVSSVAVFSVSTDMAYLAFFEFIAAISSASGCCASCGCAVPL